MDITKLEIQLHQSIVVTTKNGKFFGKLNKINNNRLELCDVEDEGGNSQGKFKFFFKRDLIGVSVENRDQDSVAKDTASLSGTLSASSTGTLSGKQLGFISQTIQEFMYIQQVDSVYFAAVDDISKQLVVAVSAEGCSLGRIYNANILTVATNTKIYIFDIAALNARKAMKELKSFLEDESCLKVMFDCRRTIDNFAFNFGVTITPVYDVMLVAAQSYPKDKIRALESCVKAVIGFDLEKSSDQRISIPRPLSQQDLLSIANKSAFLLPMYQKLMQKDYIGRYQTALDGFIGNVSEISELNQQFDSEEDKYMKFQIPQSSNGIDISIFLEE